MPAEIDFYGVFQGYNENEDIDEILSKCGKVDVTDTPIYLAINISNNNIVCNIISNNKITPTDYELVSANDVYSNFFHIRLTGNLLLNCEINEKGIIESFLDLRKSLVSGKYLYFIQLQFLYILHVTFFIAGITAFKVPKLNVILNAKNNENDIIGLTGDPTIANIFESNNQTEGNQKKKIVEKQLNVDIININLLRKATKDENIIDGEKHAPVVILDKSNLVSKYISLN